MTEINPLHRFGFALWACFVIAFWGVLGFGVGFEPDLPSHYGPVAGYLPPGYGLIVGVGLLVGFVISIAGIPVWPYTIHLMLASFVVGHTAGILL